MADEWPIVIGTRGSALALAQANMIQAQCREAFPDREFELRIIKTTGDKLQTASLANPDKSLPKGLFTKELEVALLDGTVDLAVHSLKDLPTELPDGLILGGVTEREDVRDVLVHRDGFGKVSEIVDIPDEMTIGSSSKGVARNSWRNGRISSLWKSAAMSARVCARWPSQKNFSVLCWPPRA